MIRTRILALGQSAGGDDGVGLAVLQALRQRGLPSGVEAYHLRDPTEIAAWLEADVPVLVVDAVLGSPPGEVLELTAEELAARPAQRVSSHGFGIVEALELARTLSTDAELATVRIVGITIARPALFQEGLSPEVAAAVPRAVDRILSILGENHA